MKTAMLLCILFMFGSGLLALTGYGTTAPVTNDTSIIANTANDGIHPYAYMAVDKRAVDLPVDRGSEAACRSELRSLWQAGACHPNSAFVATRHPHPNCHPKEVRHPSLRLQGCRQKGCRPPGRQRQQSCLF